MSPASEGDKMKSFAIAGLAVTALIAPAMAADMAPLPYKAPVPVMNWTGCYVGADAGAAWSAQDVANSAPSALDQAGVVGTINGAGPVGGGYAGCNLQVTPVWVVGLEGDFSATHLGGSANAINLLANGSPTTFGGIQWTSRLNWIATVRGRVGYVFAPDLMFFVTGGAAWGASNYRSFDLFAPGCPVCGGTTFSETNAGYVAGLGFDWTPWHNNWVVRMEYLYHNLGGTTATAALTPPLTGVAANPVWKDIVVQSARLGLSYKF
jgi:outer membrane immunogenic protein